MCIRDRYYIKVFNGYHKVIQDIERHVFYVLFPVVNGNDLFLRYAVLLRQAQRYRIEACCALSSPACIQP